MKANRLVGLFFVSPCVTVERIEISCVIRDGGTRQLGRELPNGSISARYRVEARSIGVLVNKLKARDDARVLSDEAIALANRALIEFREGADDAEIAWSGQDAAGMATAVSGIRSARHLLERAEAAPGKGAAASALRG
jgi:hypothetical protein